MDSSTQGGHQPKNTSIIDYNDLKLLWRIVSRNWYIAVIFVLVSYLLGYFYTYRLTDVYQVSTQIQLRNNNLVFKDNLISEGFSGSGGGAGDAYKTYMDNASETRVLQSYDLVKKAVEKLKSKLLVSYYIVGRVRVTEIYEGMPFAVHLNTIDPNLYNRRFDLDIVDVDHYEISYQEGKEIIKKQGAFDKEIIDLHFNLLIKKSGIINKESINEAKLIKYQFELHDVNQLVSTFQGGISIENPDYTSILKLNFQDVIPERAVNFLDTLSALYIENSVSARFDLNERTLNFIDKQMNEVSEVLRGIEDTMQSYKSEKRILNLEKEETDYFMKLSAYEEQKSKLSLQIDALNDLEKYIIENKDPQFLPPSVYVSHGDPFLTKEATELYQLQIKYNEQTNIATSKNFQIQEIENTIKKLKQNLLIYINNARNATKKTIENINGEISGYVGNIRLIPQKQRELLGIQRKVSVNENLYTFLLEKRASTYIARATIVPETKIIERPRVTSVVWPDKKRIQYTFAFGGLAIGMILILLRVVFFTTIQSVDELKDYTKFPILGELPHVRKMSSFGIVVENDSRSRVAESFRTLRTNLQYLNINKGSKIILVTSNGPGEGKTFCSINLAAILAKGGKRTLLLELDLHKPRVQKALEMEADVGISTVVIKSTEIDKSIKLTNVENLHVMLSGPNPPNPSEMILSNELKEILDYGKEHYDYVVIDTPPAGLISDAIYLMQYVDISLFVLNTKFTNKRILETINGLMETKKVQHFAFILNGVKRQRSAYNYNRYGYGYGYGYEYGGYMYGRGYKRGK